MPTFYLFQFSEQNNQSLSILTFVPVIDDDGKYLTCRAENPSIPDSALEDKWRLNVHCKYYSFPDGPLLNPGATLFPPAHRTKRFLYRWLGVMPVRYID